MKTVEDIHFIICKKPYQQQLSIITDHLPQHTLTQRRPHQDWCPTRPGAPATSVGPARIDHQQETTVGYCINSTL